MKANTITKEQMMPANLIPKGEYVKTKPGAPTIWVKGDYDRSSKSFSLIDCEDINREKFVKANTKLFVGFSY